jgi:hypothetical protein
MSEIGSIHLEGFSESLRGARSYCITQSTKKAQQFLRAKLAAIDTAVAHRGRKVLLFQGAPTIPKWFLPHGWDATFCIKDIQDLKLAMTYIQHCVKPLRVVWGGTEPPASVMQILARLDACTVIGIGEKSPVNMEWQALFWSPDVSFEMIESGILGRMGAQSSLRSIVKELRASEVGLVWSSIGESEKHGSLYWYDPSEAEADGESAFDPKDAAEVLRQVADSLCLKG